MILQLDLRFPGRAEAVLRLNLLLSANVVTANFCEVEPAVNLFLSLLQAPLIKVKAQFLLWQRFCQIILILWVGKGLTNFASRIFFLK